MNSSNRDGRIDEMSFGMPPNSQCPARTQNRHMCEASANSNCVDSHDRIFARRQCSCGIDGIHPDLDLLSMAERLDDEDDNNNTYVVLRPLMVTVICRSVFCHLDTALNIWCSFGW